MITMISTHLVVVLVLSCSVPYSWTQQRIMTQGITAYSLVIGAPLYVTPFMAIKTSIQDQSCIWDKMKILIIN